MRKKGHFLVEVSYGNEERVQLVVVDREVVVGQHATIALDGATLDNGKQVNRSKVAGEWSEGVLLELCHAASEGADALTGEQTESQIVGDEGGEQTESTGAVASGGKAKPRR